MLLFSTFRAMTFTTLMKIFTTYIRLNLEQFSLKNVIFLTYTLGCIHACSPAFISRSQRSIFQTPQATPTICLISRKRPHLPDPGF